jgi:integrase/recombinase XerD
LVLLYTAGLRRSELCKLTIGDYDPTEHTLLIRETKFHKSRIIPLSRDGWQELEKYLQIRKSRLLPMLADSALIYSWRRGKTNGFYNEGSISQIFKCLFRLANIKTANGSIPRVHDLRHTFAVHALLRWYYKKVDTQSKLPFLSIYMGHASVVSTQYYLRFIESVVRVASKRFEKSNSGLVKPSNKRGKT